MERKNLDALRSVAELAAYKTDIKARLQELDGEANGLPFGDAAREEFAFFQEQLVEIDRRITELNARKAYIDSLADDPGRTEREPVAMPVRRRASRVPEDIYALEQYRVTAPQDAEYHQALLDGAMKAIEVARFPHPRADQAGTKAHLERLLATIDHPEILARHILATGGPRAAQGLLGHLRGEPRAAGTGLGTYTNSGADGGYAVPFTLDPSLVLTSDGVLNPIRQIARVETITGQEWRGVTAGAVTLTRIAENQPVTGTSPTLAQPRAVPTAVKGLVPFSIEIDQDWGALQTEVAIVLQDAKDVEESTSFITATGNGITAPQGVVGGLDNTSYVHGGSGFGVDDLYALYGDLGPRHKARASWLANGAIYNLIRQFSVGDTGQGAVWGDSLAADRPPQLLGKPAYEASTMEDSEASGKALVFGDFGKFLIVDRVGSSIELIPHLFDTNGKPTGQRGIWVMYRNSSLILDDGAFRLLIFGAS